MRLISSAALPVSRWSNGAGRKADIAAGDGWLIGFAWLDEDAPFSNLAGFDRTITLVEGVGFVLEISRQSDLAITAPFHPARFDGGAVTYCRVNGPCRVLNVMTERNRFAHTVAITGAPTRLEPGSLAVALRGVVTVSAGEGRDKVSFTLSSLDAVQVDRPAEVMGSETASIAVICLAAAA